jgi:hypothetical protein
LCWLRLVHSLNIWLSPEVLSGAAGLFASVIRNMSAPARFPTLSPKPWLEIGTLLPSQIYIIDDVIDAVELKGIRKWADSVSLEDPKKPGKGEAERTAREFHFSSILWVHS